MAAIALAARRSFSQVLLKLMMYTPVWEQIICGCYTQNNTLINQKVIFLHLFYKIVHMVINTRLVSVTCIRNVPRYAMHFIENEEFYYYLPHLMYTFIKRWKCQKFTDDWCQVITIRHTDLWSRQAKNWKKFSQHDSLLNNLSECLKYKKLKLGFNNAKKCLKWHLQILLE
jgi:hypothetical protein